MKKIIIIAVIVVAAGALIFLLGGSDKNNSTENNSVTTGGKDIGNVCSYFPKELLETALGKPILKVESPFTDGKTCFYYTTYSETYDHTPYGDKPGGAKVVIVYDDEDFAKDRISNEKSGSVYGTDVTIGMENYVVRRKSGDIWLVALVLGNDKYIRMHFIDNAVTGEDLIKIATELAKNI